MIEARLAEVHKSLGETKVGTPKLLKKPGLKKAV